MSHHELKWMIWCEEDEKWECVIQEDAPTACPVDAEHDIGAVLSSGSVVAPVYLRAPDGTIFEIEVANDGTLSAEEVT